jgi:hypothetical protein
LPPFWFRPSVTDTFQRPTWHPPSLGLAIGTLLVLVGILAWCGWDARRRHDRTAGWALATGGVALAAALVTAAKSPITGFGPYTPHGLRFLWPLAAFVVFAIVATVAGRVNGSPTARRRTGPDWIVAGALLLVVVFAALNLPYANLGDGPNSQEWAIPAQRQLQAQLSALHGHGPLLIDDLFLGAFADPYGGAVLVELQQRNIDFVARDPGLVRQLGPDRQFTGRNATQALLLRIGDQTRIAPPGTRRIALGEGLPTSDQHELTKLTKQIGDYLRRHGIQLNTRGQDALRRGLLPSLSRIPSFGPGLDPTTLFTSRELGVLIDRHDLVLDPTWAARIARYSYLQGNWDKETVALFVGPIQAPANPGRRVGQQ